MNWLQLNLLKSIFYIFFAVRRRGKAFLAYALGWIMIGNALPAIISALLGLILGKAIVAIMLLMPLPVILTIMVYCCFYPTYLKVFERSEQNLSLCNLFVDSKIFLEFAALTPQISR